MPYLRDWLDPCDMHHIKWIISRFITGFNIHLVWYQIPSIVQYDPHLLLAVGFSNIQCSPLFCTMYQMDEWTCIEWIISGRALSSASGLWLTFGYVDMTKNVSKRKSLLVLQKHRFLDFGLGFLNWKYSYCIYKNACMKLESNLILA
jgi:hypothetical protein